MRINLRGNPNRLGDEVAPHFLSVLTPAAPPVFKDGSGRLELANAIAAHPIAARVIVNRIWKGHFGTGIVDTPSNFGVNGERPTHPELLEWLAQDFVSHGWRLKRLHRMIVTSAVYQQDSTFDADKAKVDLENRLLWCRSPQRLEAEILRDAMLAVSGSLNEAMFGPPVPVRPDVHGQIVVGVDKTEGDNKMPVDVPLNGEEFRRAIYIQARRSRPLAMLHAFDAPVMEVNCERRQSSTVATQSLMLMNSPFILEQSMRFARRLQKESGEHRRQQITRAWQLAFSRDPETSELASAASFLDETSQSSDRLLILADRRLHVTGCPQLRDHDRAAPDQPARKPARMSHGTHRHHHGRQASGGEPSGHDRIACSVRR